MTSYILLKEKMLIGRGRTADVQLRSPEISREHLLIEQVDNRFRARDLTNYQPHDLHVKSGSRLNGKYFSESFLVFGDRLTIGNLTFRFDGKGLLPIDAYVGTSVTVRHLCKQAGDKEILHDISLDIAPGSFVGILGTSGAGKSTFLDAISGIRPASSGHVMLDGMQLEEFLVSRSSMLGYVPQSDIIHFELTVRQAVRFSALLRLPRGTPEEIVEDCVDATMKRLDLDPIADLQVANISGGQQKRVSIAAEILSCPFILFLDEPSSGLDPSTEAELMAQLRELADLGCTVICTTHVMENVHSFDSLVILSKGHLIFQGSPAAARKFFEINRFAALYDCIKSKTIAHWREKLGDGRAEKAAAPLLPGAQVPEIRTSHPNAFALLLKRQYALMVADWKSPALVMGQPMAIGILLGWMANTCGVMLFIAHLATFWFGCSNASQEIVKESAIFRRERLIGVKSSHYLLAKGVFWTVVVSIQAALLYCALHFGRIQIEGDMGLQLLSLAGTTLASVAIGLALSAWAKTATQATRAVPLILIPQIILSGYVLPPMKGEGLKQTVIQAAPSHASQMLMDMSLLWKTEFSWADQEKAQNFYPALQNISALADLSEHDIFDERSFPQNEVKKLIGWTLLGSVIAYLGLIRKGKE